MADPVFVSDRVLLDIGFAAARARLGMLARDGVLLQAAEVAYGDALTGMAQAVGSLAGRSRLAGVCAEGLAGTGEGARVALRWEAIAANGKLFATLDGDLMLIPAGEQITVLAMAGGYRPPPATAAAGLDRAIVHQCAAAAIRSFLARMACALVHPAGAAGLEGGNSSRRSLGKEKP